MNSWSQLQVDQIWILRKELKANGFFWDSQPMRVTEEPVCIDLSVKSIFYFHAFEISRSFRTASGPSKGLQRDVVYLDWPIAPLYMGPNAGGRGDLRGFSQWVQLYVHRSPNKLGKSYSIFMEPRFMIVQCICWWPYRLLRKAFPL
jgi:hypothetical protein